VLSAVTMQSLSALLEVTLAEPTVLRLPVGLISPAIDESDELLLMFRPPPTLTRLLRLSRFASLLLENVRAWPTVARLVSVRAIGCAALPELLLIVAAPVTVVRAGSARLCRALLLCMVRYPTDCRAAKPLMLVRALSD